MAFSSPNLKICVVDDDLDVLNSLRFLLETEGFDVRIFRSGAAMLDAASTLQFDCFVLDSKMLRVGGIAVANSLRDRTLLAPVVSLGGYPDDNKGAKLDPEESLASRIRVAVQRHRSLRQTT